MARSLFDAINAAAATLQNATMDSRDNDAAQETARTEEVRPNRPTPNPSRNGGEKAGAKKPTAKPTKPKAAPKTAPSLEDAIKAAAAKVGGRPTDPSRNGGEKAGAKKAAPKTDTPKTKGGAKYVIPAAFKEAIENYLKSRADLKERMTAKGKTLDGCCDYIFDVMRKRAESNRKGASAVGLYADPQEIFGLAVHYYDESDEDLKAELNGKKER